MATYSASIGLSPRRFEVITGEPERRSHDDAFKAELVARSFAPDVCIADLARDNGLHPQLLYTWRAEAKKGRLALPAERAPMFAAVIAEEPTPNEAPPSNSEVIIELGDVRLRIGADVSPERVAALVAALKATL